jgi:BolA protein
MSDRVERIRSCLTQAFQPQQLDVVDDSHKHAGHAGAQSGGGHFNVLIVSEAFAGQSLIQRHRAVYAALGELMQQEIHALSIQAKTPAEL